MNVDYTLISIGYHTSIYQQFLKENIEPNDLIEFIEWGNAKKEKSYNLTILLNFCAKKKSSFFT